MTARRRAVVFGPVQPTFDTRFFDPISGWLRNRGHEVEILDSLAVVDDTTMSVDDVAAEWLRRRPDLIGADLLCGNAFGGAVVASMLPALDPDTAVLMLSAPTVADELLAARLGEVARHARQGNLAGALWTLDDYVRSELLPSPATAAAAPVGDTRAACRRIELGMSLLASIDLTTPVTEHAGPVLSIVGERSRLVTTATVRVPAHGVVAEIPDAGMRPHRDNWIAVEDVLTTYRKYLAHTGERLRVAERINTVGAA